jgi:uncharacterized protein (TIGR03437 family)
MQIGIWCTALICAAAMAGEAPIRWEGPYRGFNTHSWLSEKDIRDLAATGANVVRIGFATEPMLEMTAPYAVKESALAHLDYLLTVCEEAGVRVVIDPHTAPGFTSPWAPWTTVPQDPFWKASLPYQDAFVKLWSAIAARYKDRGAVIAGYDLLNEPGVYGTPGQPSVWDELSKRLIAAIREHDKVHTIVIEPPTVYLPDKRVMDRMDLDGLYRAGFLSAPPDDNVVYSPHFYSPSKFTFQGVSGNPMPTPPIAYPGVVDGVKYDRTRLEELLRGAALFQHRFGVPVFVGEFGNARWLGDDGNRWLADAIRVFEKYNWSWANHAWRECECWDAERSNTDKNDAQVYGETPRLQMLREAFAKNSKREGPVMWWMANAASFAEGTVAPGEMVEIGGAGLGPADGLGMMWTQEGRIAKELGGVQVAFEGMAAPVTYASSGRVRAIVPYGVAGKEKVRLSVRYRGGVSDEMEVWVTATAPGLFSADGSGSGAGLILNEDGRMNSAVRAAEVGSVVTLFATGEGETNPAGVDGQPTPEDAQPRPLSEVKVRVGGVDAEVVSVGGARGMYAGVLEVQVRVPAVEAGPEVPVVVTVGGLESRTVGLAVSATSSGSPATP